MRAQRERLEAKLAELKRTIGRLARSDGNDGALATELGKLNEEYGQTQNQVDEVEQALESLKADGPTEDEVREALQKLDPLWDELFPAEKERIVKLLVEDIIVTTSGIDIRFRTNGIEQIVNEIHPQEDTKHE